MAIYAKLISDRNRDVVVVSVSKESRNAVPVGHVSERRGFMPLTDLCLTIFPLL